MFYTVGKRARVTVSLHDPSGRSLLTFRDEVAPAGSYVISSADAATRFFLPSGIYFLRIRAGAETVTRKLTVLH